MTTLSRVARITALVGLCGFVLGGCVSRRLADRPVEGEPIRLVVRIAPDARVNASYSVRLDPDDPVGSLVSIGTTFAKADQAMRAEQRMNAALRTIDLEALIGNGMTDFFAFEMDMPAVPSARDATYRIAVDVLEYGIDAGRPGSAVRFVLRGRAEMHDRYTGERVWRMTFREEQQVSPAVFGLPPAAGNVLSAAMLADLSEAEITRGIERVARDATWSMGERFQRDLYRARRLR